MILHIVTLLNKIIQKHLCWQKEQCLKQVPLVYLLYKYLLNPSQQNQLGDVDGC